MYMSSLYLTSQVGIVIHWCWACIQCSFHWNWILLERKKHSLKGYGCPKIPGLWKSQAITLAKENLVGLYVTFNSMALLTHHCWSSFTSFNLATLTVVSRSLKTALSTVLGTYCQNQSESNNIAWIPQDKPKWRVFWISLTSLSAIFRRSKISKTGVNTTDFNVILFWNKHLEVLDSHSTLNLKSASLAIRGKPHQSCPMLQLKVHLAWQQSAWRKAWPQGIKGKTAPYGRPGSPLSLQALLHAGTCPLWKWLCTWALKVFSHIAVLLSAEFHL